ncbi:hypothetical protein T265_05090 [Opisthorchis viverrini]|uniref:Uncharacterized protein n=1 Tax=Opisthorchis viverrini TaxID=6198 RepID=A0A074ZLK2_OPIVI|nr:hypothetical protein T265_05090 [Opisthorchis viverrini]KER27966.1 hypothetical protein T265_05090 [Opisthorchis viverrini]
MQTTKRLGSVAQRKLVELEVDSLQETTDARMSNGQVIWTTILVSTVKNSGRNFPQELVIKFNMNTK